MSAVASAKDRLAAVRPKGRISPWWILIGLAAALFLLSVLQLVTGADDLASSGTIRATIIATVPIALAGLGGLWSERSGVVNIGLEGMMILGTFGAGFFGYHYGPWAGVVGAIALGAIGGLIHAVATVVFGVDHIISGVAINIIALGATQYLAALTFTGLPGGGQTQSPTLGDVNSITIGPLSDALGDIEGGVVRQARLAAGGVGTRPWRLRACEAALIGKAPGRQTLEAAARLALEGTRALSGNHYKVELLPRTIVRALEMAGEAA